MTKAISSTRTKNYISFYNQIKTKTNQIYCRVNDFIKKNFLNLVGFTLIIGSYFTFGFEVSLALIGTFAILQVSKRLFNSVKASKKVTRKSSNKIRKISEFICDKIGKVTLSDGGYLHDSVKWLKVYNSKSWPYKKYMRKKIGEETLNTINKSRVENVFSLSKTELDTMKQNTNIVGKDIKTCDDEKKYFSVAISKNTMPTKKEAQKLKIIEGDSFDVALTLKKENKYNSVAVLNMANKDHPGGAFLRGCSAQEEALCRRSTLYASINTDQIEGDETNFNPHLRAKMNCTYQIPEFGAIYSPKVKVFRGNQDKDGYAYFKKPEEVNIISSAAYNIYASKPENYREKTKRKLQMILNTALETNQQCVVLGAYGCGAFGNDPKEIATITKEILKERPIYQKKMNIVFGIIKDSHDKGNIENFSSILQNV